MLALSVGQIAGAATVQFFGQIVARGALLASRGISTPVNIAMAAYERLIAVAVSALMALGGAWYLFGQVAIDFGGGGTQFVRIAAGVAFSIAAGACAAWGSKFLKAISGLATAKAIFAIARNILLTFSIQLTTAAAYVIIAVSVSENTPPSQLLAASVIIMFAASMPISFSGWGVRELSAVFALGAIGVSSSAALAVSILIGAMALGAVIVTAGLAAVHAAALSPPFTRPFALAESNAIAVMLKWSLPLAAATAVFFQIRIPIDATSLNVNLADPIAILSAGIFIIEYLVPGKVKWRSQLLGTCVALTTSVILVSYLHGYYSIGWTDWAFANRLLGWVVLLCYGMTGALIFVHAGSAAAVIFIRTFIFSAVGVVLFEFALLFIYQAGIKIPSELIVIPFEGFSQNRNAFSLALLLAICGLPMIPQRHRSVPLAILMIGLWLAGSRAAFGAFAIVAALVLYLRIIGWKQLALVSMAAGAVLLTLHFVSIQTEISTVWGGLPVVIDMNIRDSSNIQRFATISDGLKLFFSHPLFGAGLGYYIHEQTKLGLPIVIHSTPVWLLAETGIFGFAAFAVPVMGLFLREWRLRWESPVSQLIILILVTFAIMSSVHELLYQRALWLLLGLTAAFVV